MIQDPPFDIIVIGGGPAGMMAAGTAAAHGARVLLLEKNPQLGKKLLITGGGRCNILNAEFDTRPLVERYGRKGKALFSVFSQFDVQATWDFFVSRGLPLKVEAEKRAFPASEQSEDVLKTMKNYLAEGDVQVRTNVQVKTIEADQDRITKLILEDGEVTAVKYILCTGGKSRPETGSTGDGFSWLRELGHTVIEPDPALVPVTLKDAWTSELAGLSFPDAKLTLWQDAKKISTARGKLLFTHVGISGPVVLNMSKRIGELLQGGDVLLTLDLFPLVDIGTLDSQLLQHFETAKNKMIKNHIGELIPPRLGLVLLTLAGIDGTIALHQVTREQRRTLVRFLKEFPMHVSGLLGAEKAIVTSGGLALDEVDFKTMRSKRFSNLFLAGDVLDFDRPSGGFSLQICWSTGFVAGRSAAASRPSPHPQPLPRGGGVPRARDGEGARIREK